MGSLNFYKISMKAIQRKKWIFTVLYWDQREAATEGF